MVARDFGNGIAWHYKEPYEQLASADVDFIDARLPALRSACFGTPPDEYPLARGHRRLAVPGHAVDDAWRGLVALVKKSTLWPSALVAGLFAIHPLRVESVAWVTERKDVLSGLCFMLTWRPTCTMRGGRSPCPICDRAPAFALALLSKAIVVTVPALLLLLDYWPLGRYPGCGGWGRDERETARGGEGEPRGRWSAAEFSPSPLAAFASRAWLLAEKLPLLASGPRDCRNPLGPGPGDRSRPAVWPGVAAEVYPNRLRGLPRPVVLPGRPGGFVSPPVMSAAVANHRRHGAAGGHYRGRVALETESPLSAGRLALVLGDVCAGDWHRAARHGGDGRSEHLFDAARAGNGDCLGAADACRGRGAGCQPARTAADWQSAPRTAAALIAAVVLAILMAVAWRQTWFWHDSETFWNRTLACTSNNVVAHTNLGVYFGEVAHRPREAAAQFHKALDLDPKSFQASYSLGSAISNWGSSARRRRITAGRLTSIRSTFRRTRSSATPWPAKGGGTTPLRNTNRS